MDAFEQGFLDGMEKVAKPDYHAARMEKPGFLSLWTKRSMPAAHTRKLLEEMLIKRRSQGWRMSQKKTKLGDKLNLDFHPTTFARDLRGQ